MALYNIVMEKLSLTMEHGTIMQWHKRPGDQVKEGDLLAEVTTDKVNMAVESPYNGVLAQVLKEEGEIVPVLQVIAVIDGPAGQTVFSAGEAPSTAAPPPAPAPMPAATPPSGGDVQLGNQEYLLLMEKLSLTMEKGTLMQWHKRAGQMVASGEVVAEVATDKVNMEIESPYTGVLKRILVAEGQEAPCLTPIGVIEGPAGQTVLSEAAAPTEAQPSPVLAGPSPATTQPQAAGGRLSISPAARKLASEQGVDPETLTGRGPDGRIVLADVEEAVARQPQLTHLAAKTAELLGVPAAILPRGRRLYCRDIEAAAAAADTGLKTAAGPDTYTEPLGDLKAAMSRNMQKSWQTAPHVTLNRRITADGMIQLRTSLKEHYGEKVSYTDIILKAASMALELYPIINSSLQDNTVIYHRYVNLGIATDTPQGLLVPVVKNAQGLSLLELSRAAAAQIDKAQRNRVKLEDISGGTFTVTSLGGFGIDDFTPVINPPESAILGVGAIGKEVVPDGAGFRIASRMSLSLSFDHRHIDGATAARFLAAVAKFLENPFYFAI